jgi:cobalt-zinc-cadmium efflux system protein
MSYSHEHHHHHHHHGITHLNKINVFWVVFLNLAITIAEVVGGLLSGSLALLSDALHNLGDTIAIFFSFISIKIAQKTANHKKPYGYKRANILSAFINSTSLLIISVYLSFESISRFLHPKPINGDVVIIVSFIGFVANLISILLLSKDAKHSLNIRSSYLHFISDMLSSIIVLLSGIFIKYGGIYWIDPVFTIFINLLIIKSVYYVLKESTHILMQGAPEKINMYNLKKDVLSMEGVHEIIDMKAWQLDEHEIYMELKIGTKDMLLSEGTHIKNKIQHLIKEHYGIHHCIIELQCVEK